jgi:hypothetical protein
MLNGRPGVCDADGRIALCQCLWPSSSPVKSIYRGAGDLHAALAQWESAHNAFNCSPRAILNINRASMADDGFSPPTRVFEAAGARACLITEAWQGIELCLEMVGQLFTDR